MSVWIEHPEMPGRRVEVPDLSLPHYRAAGWVETEPPAKPRKPKPALSASAPASPAAGSVVGSRTDSKTESAPRRRTTKED